MRKPKIVFYKSVNKQSKPKALKELTNNGFLTSKACLLTA